MARTAEYSIKGYLYQFVKYLSELLNASAGQSVTIEGAIEDIDVSSASAARAIQCKYHEQVDKFTLSKIYKPLLLMMEHFSKNPTPAIPTHYHLFCHFPGSTGKLAVTTADLTTVIGTQAAGLVSIVKRIAQPFDYAAFLSRLTVEFGPPLEELEGAARDQLVALGFTEDDVAAIIYPAAIQRIVDTSIQGTVANRTLTRAPFVAELKDVKQVTFTRWTRELSSKKAIFTRLRKELKSGLDRNSRRRIFLIDPTHIANFDEDIVKFLKAFIEKYSFKYLHKDPPTFAFGGSTDVGNIELRLHDKAIYCATGMVGSEFRKAQLFRKCVIEKRGQTASHSFRLRITRAEQIDSVNDLSPDEVFLVNVNDCPWTLPDIVHHRFEIERMADLEYILQLRDSYG